MRQGTSNRDAYPCENLTVSMKKFLLGLLPLLATMDAGAITFDVEVPAGTRAVYVAGKFNNWDAASPLRLQKIGTSDRWSLTSDEISETDIAGGFKYLCGPGWTYVEKSDTGAEVPDRTSLGNPDKVGSWYHAYNPDIRETKIIVNGYERRVRVWAPEGYAESGKKYPVLYYTGVQQRYESAGSDNAGDDFLGADSWNAANLASEASAECIIVEMYSFVAENIPFTHESFSGSGATDAFLSDYVSKVIGWVKENYPIDDRADAATIMGADLGGLQAVYAALKYPDIFGRCVAVSPLLWLNRTDISALADESRAKFLFAYGTAEKSLIGDDVNSLADMLGDSARTVALDNGVHKDTSWAAIVGTALRFASEDNPDLPASIKLSAPKTIKLVSADEFNLESVDWRLYSGLDTQDLTIDDTQFTLCDAFVAKNGTTKKVKTLVRVVPADFKKTFYWNISDDSGEGYLLTENKKTSFSSKKSVDSWIRVVLNEDGSVESNSAAKTGFTVVPTAGSKVAMTPGQASFKQRATVPFITADKKFAINYGSVNSLSDMGALTGVYSVSDECVEAEITYDYLTNEVTIKETKWGATIGDVKIEYMTVTPSVAYTGANVKLRVKIDESSHCTPIAMISTDYGTASALTLTESDGEWTANLNSLTTGLHRVYLSLKRGETVKENVVDVAALILPGSDNRQKYLTVNAYKDIDWASINRYKANFHTHTSQSFDTKFKTSDVVDLYKGAGYQVLALTDHDANPFPWDNFDLFNPEADSRNADELGMLSVPGVELSKDNRNTWDEATGGSFNHHNDFFTGRKGQEFASLRESYAYTNAIGGLQIINHPGQYWSLDKTYTPGEKNSPEWHAENFRLYPSLIGLEVYNQGNRRPNDRILWDQILTLTMPQRPVWGYSCDDTHTREQYFRNYEFMLMPDLTDESLKEAMRKGNLCFSYEYNGSGNALAPHIESVAVDADSHRITVSSSDADRIEWIYSTDKQQSAASSTRRSTVVGVGPTFDYTGYQGSYVRPSLTNAFGETCLQPFGFDVTSFTGVDNAVSEECSITVSPNPVSDRLVIEADAGVGRVSIFDIVGRMIYQTDCGGVQKADINVAALARGLNIVMVTAGDKVMTSKVLFD